MLRIIPRTVFRRVARSLSSGKKDFEAVGPSSTSSGLWAELRSKNARANQHKAHESRAPIDSSASAAALGQNAAEGEGEVELDEAETEDEGVEEEDEDYDDEDYDENDEDEDDDDDDDDDEEEEDRSRKNRRHAVMNSIPDAIAPLLFDHEFIKDRAMQGMTIQNEHLDPLDVLLADTFIDSMKTEDNSAQILIKNDASKRVVLPTPRSMEQLNHAMLPPPINAPKGSLAHALATAAWGMVHKNHYYTPSQQLEVVQSVASHVQLFEQRMQKDAEETVMWDDMIMAEGFKKGFSGWQREQEALRNKDVVVQDFGEGKGDTDWNVNAVVDEDQL